MNDAPGGSPETPKRHDFFIGIDSDGCAFDTMEVKHKECFIPNIVRHFGLAAVSGGPRGGRVPQPLLAVAGDEPIPRPGPDARPARRPARGRPTRGSSSPTGGASRLARPRDPARQPALKAEVERIGDPDLALALAWSEAVNRWIGEIVRDVPPFPLVRESLGRCAGRADVMVVSATPGRGPRARVGRARPRRYVALIAGQETGARRTSWPWPRRPLRAGPRPDGRRRPRRPPPPRPTASCSTRSTPAPRTSPGAGSTTRPSPGSSKAPTPAPTWPSGSPGSGRSCPRSRPGAIMTDRRFSELSYGGTRWRRPTTPIEVEAGESAPARRDGAFPIHGRQFYRLDELGIFDAVVSN